MILPEHIRAAVYVYLRSDTLDATARIGLSSRALPKNPGDDFAAATAACIEAANESAEVTDFRPATVEEIKDYEAIQ